MRTLRAAALLLAEASSLDQIAPIAAAAGCGGTVSPLDVDLLGELGLASLGRARIVEGVGALRALLLDIRERTPLRELLCRVAARLASRTPHVLWLVVVTQPAAGQLGIAAWTDDRRPPRVAALCVDRARVVDSDAETLVALGGAADPRPDADVLTHARWVEVLGREALTRRFYRTLEHEVGSLAASLPRGAAADRRELAILYCSRLLFLSFLEAKLWLDGDPAFLSRGFDRCLASGSGYHRRVLLPLFFGTLNTRPAARAPVARALGNIPFLNGGLFSPAPCERRLRGVVFPDERFGALFGDLFARYRFTAREESARWVELAVDPEMLGKAFESLMHADDRKASGSFYTPHALVERVTAAGLARVLATSPDTCHASSVAELSEIARRTMRARLDDLTVLDPACGSGAFLVHVLEQIAALRAANGDDRPIGVVRREVLTRSIFGVDRNPTAVWLCELRLWLSVVIECDADSPSDVPPLPNLDRNVRVGDSLAGDGMLDAPSAGGVGMRLRRLRDRYARSCGAHKESLGRQLDREERRVALARLDREIAAVSTDRRDLLVAMRGRDLFGARREATSEERAHAADLRARLGALRSERRRLHGGGALPFSFSVHFADVAARGGFDLVLGNPPWVRLHRIPRTEREALRRRYRVFRAPAWEGGATRAHAGAGFAAQVDLAALFVEGSLRLLRAGGALSLLVPVKLWHSLAGGGLRRLLADDARVVELEDFADAPAAFDAAVYPSLLVAERWSPAAGASSSEDVTASAHRRGCPPLSWCVSRRALAFDESSGSPWLVVPRDVRVAFDRLRDAGTPLSESAVGRPHLGVKCGFNLAYIVQRLDSGTDPLATVVAANGRRGTVERELLRPVMRGEGLKPWQAPEGDELVIWTHGPGGAPLERLPSHAARWLGPWRRQLAARADARGRCWWSLFRTDAARIDRPRVVWADLGRAPRATMLRQGDVTVPLNSCYVALCPEEDDALALLGVLNSALARAWLAALAEPARGGYRRYLGWTMSLLPLPRDWTQGRRALCDVARRAVNDPSVSMSIEAELLDASLAAYRLRRRDVAPLLEWFGV